jgi:hypothetical protein
VGIWIYDGMEIDGIYSDEEDYDGSKSFNTFLRTAGPGGIADARARYALHSTHDPQYPKAGNTGITTGIPGRAGGSDGGWNPDYIPPAYVPPAGGGPTTTTTAPLPVTPPPGGTPVTGTPTGGPPSGGNPPGGAGGWGGGVAGGRPTTGTPTGTTTGTTTTGTTTATNIPWGLIIAAVVVLFLLRK